MLAENAHYLLNIVALGMLLRVAIQQWRRGNSLEQQYLESLNTIADLEAELEHSQNLAWNRLSDGQKDAAIRMG